MRWIKLLQLAIVLSLAVIQIGAGGKEAEPPSHATLARWLDQLRDGNPAIRQSAIESLRDAGEDARGALESAMQSPILQVKTAAVQLLDVLDTQELLDQISAATRTTRPLAAEVTQTYASDPSAKTRLIYRSMGDGRHVSIEMTSGTAAAPIHTLLIADGASVWDEASIAMGQGVVDTTVRKSSIPSFEAQRPGELKENPFFQFLQPARLIFDFAQLPDKKIEGTGVLLLMGKLRRENMLDYASVFKAVREGSKEAAMMIPVAQLMTVSRARLSAGRQDFLPRKLEYLDADGKVLSSIDFKFNTKPELDEESFRYYPPEKVPVVEVDADPSMIVNKSAQELRARRQMEMER